MPEIETTLHLFFAQASESVTSRDLANTFDDITTLYELTVMHADGQRLPTARRPRWNSRLPDEQSLRVTLARYGSPLEIVLQVAEDVDTLVLSLAAVGYVLERGPEILTKWASLPPRIRRERMDLLAGSDSPEREPETEPAGDSVSDSTSTDGYLSAIAAIRDRIKRRVGLPTVDHDG